MANKRVKKPHGRVRAYGFFMKMYREERKKEDPTSPIHLGQFSKDCAKKWRTLTDVDKRRYHELATRDQRRYEAEMKSYKPVETVSFKHRCAPCKDPNAPKRPLTSFFLFSMEERNRVKESNPKLRTGAISKELGRRWSQAPPVVKSKFHKLADKHKARYQKEMAQYKLRTSMSN